MKKNIQKHSGSLRTFLIAFLLLNAFNSRSQNRTFIQEDVIKVSGALTGDQALSLPASQRTTTRTYLDGLGRTVQTVSVAASPNQKDIVQPIAYNNLGRQTTQYLPYVVSTGTGAFRSNALSEQATFYSTSGQKIAVDTKPYAQQLFDNSPLQRLLRSGNFGDGYQTDQHYKTVSTGFNQSETLYKWNTDGSYAGTYGVGSLEISVVTDEEGGQVTLFTDKIGQTILKRQLISSGGVLYADTYYVYDDAGALLFIVPPKAVQQMQGSGNYNLNQNDISSLLFKYVYDDRGRVVERQVPGAGAMYLVYDPLDRLVLAQNAKLRTANKWNYIKYDCRNTPISQGIYTNNLQTTRAAMQSYVNSLDYGSNKSETRNTDVNTGYYSNQIFPTTDIEPLAYSYFDDYDLDGNGSADYSYQTQGITGEDTAAGYTAGFSTIVRKRTIGNGLSNIWLTSVNFYNKKGNLIQTISNNHLNATISSSSTLVLDFSGKIVRSKKVQVVTAATTTVADEFTYDHRDRLKTIDEQHNGGSVFRVAAYEYNELGQLADKKLHSTNSGSSYLQSVDYRYTIQGQLSSINNSTLTVDGRNDDSNDVFGMELLYHQSDGTLGNTIYYNGLVSAVKWKVNAPGVVTANERSYRFNYDKLLRLNSAVYADRNGGSTWGNNGAFDEKNITYDVNGNILTLQRNAMLSSAISAIDELNYSYSGNQLSNVTDGSGANYVAYGFKNNTGSSSGFDYDEAGNQVNDYKKGINISYNLLNKSDRITITTHNGRYIDYTYNADGVVIRKQAFDNSALVKTTDYVDGFVYENSSLSYFAMAEGRIRNVSGILKAEYMIADQQGNVRVSFEEQNGVAVVRQENSYYPFGLIMPGSNLPTAANKNLYNGGSEWQDDFSDQPDLYQTYYRMYNAALGRFIAVDPIAEASESLSTYQYADDCPVLFNDPLGDQTQPTESYRIGAGSGNHWSDGIQFSDWTAWGGSDTFREALSSGLQYVGGSFYAFTEQGRVEVTPGFNVFTGDFGYWRDKDIAVSGKVSYVYNSSSKEWVTSLPTVTKAREFVSFGTPWMSVAMKELGVQEATRNNDGEDVEKYLRSGGLGKGNPWCGAFVNWTLLQTNIKVVGVNGNPNYALNWRGFGQHLMKPAIGAIATKTRNGGGHVGFVAGITPNGDIILLGGNQGDAVSLKSENSNVLKYNFPNGYAPNYNLPVLNAEKLKSMY